MLDMIKLAVARATAFMNGAFEFRSDVTLHYEDANLMDAYDAGRDFAHRVTLRRYDA